jgi:hypothetical protein
MRCGYLTAALALLMYSAAGATPPAGERVSFVSCPVVRDTRSVPCWLSEYNGDLYYLTIQSDVSATVQPPMLGHQVLVEGVVSDAAPICGGIVLEPVRLSVMPELDANCNTLLPADDRYVIDFNPRPPGPSAGRLAFAPDPAAPPATPPPPLQGPQTIDIYFDFDRGVSFRHPDQLMAILRVARNLPARHARITGVRGAHRLTDGSLLRESDGVDRRRAEEVAELLRGAGLEATAEVTWIDGEAEADGIDDWRTRRVTVELLAAPARADFVGEPSGTGPFTATAEVRAELPDHTLFRPVSWPADPLPLYVWGNGGCSSNGLAHAAYLRQIASQGYVVVALGVPGGGPPAPADGSRDATDASQMIEAIDWATRETAREGGEFYRRIDTSRMAVGGHSCGGLQALAVSHDPRIATTLVLNSGIYITPGGGRSRVEIDKTQLSRLHAPLLYLSGGPADIAHENALDDVARIDHVPVFFGALPVGHGGTFAQPDGGEWARISARWLDWQLKDDADASRDFAGADCRLCADERWSIEQKQLPPPTGPIP